MANRVPKVGGLLCWCSRILLQLFYFLLWIAKERHPWHTRSLRMIYAEMQTKKNQRQISATVTQVIKAEDRPWVMLAFFVPVSLDNDENIKTWPCPHCDCTSLPQPYLIPAPSGVWWVLCWLMYSQILQQYQASQEQQILFLLILYILFNFSCQRSVQLENFSEFGVQSFGVSVLGCLW